MYWIDTIRKDPRAVASLMEFFTDQRSEISLHYRHTKTMEDVARIHGRLDTINAIEASFTADDREVRDAAERNAQRERAIAGVVLHG